MSGIGGVLGYEFRMSPAIPFGCIVQHMNFNRFFLLFHVFYKNVLAARVRSMVAKVAFMQNFENGFFWLLKKSEKVQLWGVKSPCAGPCGVQNLLAVAER